jgi:hypothetical protein
MTNRTKIDWAYKQANKLAVKVICASSDNRYVVVREIAAALRRVFKRGQNSVGRAQMISPVREQMHENGTIKWLPQIKRWEVTCTICWRGPKGKWGQGYASTASTRRRGTAALRRHIWAAHGVQPVIRSLPVDPDSQEICRRCKATYAAHENLDAGACAEFQR